MAHDTTPMGSTTKLVLEKKPPSRYCPSISTGLVALSLSCSLGNIFRLPRMVFLHGGGSFLLLYTIITIVFGIPLAFLEIVLGQFCQQGTTKLWRAVPLLKGVGYVKILCSFLLGVYYPVVMTISLFYALWTMKGPLPFPDCIIYKDLNGVEVISNVTGQQCLTKTFLKPPDEDPMWLGVNVTLLFLIWAFVMLCISRGSRSYRMSAIFLLFPFIGGLVALITNQALTSTEGLQNLYTISLEPFKSFDLWYYAVIQFFISTHIGFGNIVTCAGNIYSKSNAFWTSLFYIICNVLVGIGVVSLMYLWDAILQQRGFVSQSQNFEVEELFTLSLIYDVARYMPDITQRIWAIVAFFLIVFAGFVSMAALIYTVVISIAMETKNQWRTWLITAMVCGIGLIAGVALMLPEKLSLLHMLDYYVIGRMIAMTTALELVGLIWIYGKKAIYNDFEFVLGYKLSWIWSVIWFTAPIFIVVVEVWSLFALPLTGENHHADSEWLYITGWSIYAFLWLIILFLGIWQISSQVGYNCGQKFLSTLKPSRNWGPVDPIYRHGWVQWKSVSLSTGERDFTLKRRGTRDYTHTIRNETRYNAMGNTTLRSNHHNSPYVIHLPDGLDFSDHVCWRGREKMDKT